jgi:short-subunit dehydrogenase
MDLSEPGAGGRLAAETDRLGLRVTGLINNAGFGTHGLFQDEDPDRLRDEVAVNIAALVDITRAYIDGLRAAGTGILVNVASTAAYQPIPKMATYAATKAFVLSFTEALWYESRGNGLRVTCLSPGATDTEFFDVVGTNSDAGTPHQTPAEVATTALKALDRRTPPPSVVSGRLNRILTGGSRLLPRRATLLVAGRMI